MWMRSCAVCKALLKKLQLCDSLGCQCGWEWSGHHGLDGGQNRPEPAAHNTAMA